MKVKVGKLKTHLSRYLSHIREGGEAIEVCVREQPVAYLTAVQNANTTAPDHKSDLELQQRLLDCGLMWNAKPVSTASSFIPKPQTAGDGSTDIDTVQTMRNEKDW